jgi:hypothetical protein
MCRRNQLLDLFWIEMSSAAFHAACICNGNASNTETLASAVA